MQSILSVGEKLDETKRLARLEAQVRQAFASFRGAESPNRPPLPAAHTIKQFITHVESASVRDVDLEVADVRKCLLSLGLTVDDAALVLETLDPKASGYIDARVLAKHYLPNNVGDTSSGNKRSQFALASVTSVAKSSGADTDERVMKQLHRKVLERVLVKSKAQNVKDAFRQYDADKTGSLTLPQFRTFLRDHGVAGTDVERLIKHLDRDSHGSISFHAFSGDGKLGAAQSYPKSTSPKKQLAVPDPLAMSSPSKRKSGSDDVDTALDPMEAIRAKLRQRVMGHNKSIREVFLDFDDDGNGHLDYDEFKRFMTKYKFTADETAQTIAYLDRDFSGTIDYDEFAAGLLFFRPPPAQLAASSSPYVKHTVLGGKPALVQPDHVVTAVQQKLEARLHVQHDTDSTKQWLRDEFQRYDTEHKRGLDYQEFGAFLVGMGIKLRADELSALVAVVDTDGSEVIGFDEFARLYPPIAGTDNDDNDRDDMDDSVADSDATLAAVFRKHDVDKSGYLDYEEFADLLRDVGLSEPDILHVIKQVDHDDAPLGRADGRRARGRVSYATVASVVHKRKLKLHDGVVSTREHAGGSQYAQWVTRVLQTHRSLEDAFNQNDTDGSGELDHDEFRRFLKQYGMKRDGDIDALLDRIDTDGSGTVSLDEFLAVFDRRKAVSRVDKTQEQQQRQPSGTKQARLESLREKESVWVHHAVREHGSVENAFRAFDRHGHDELSYQPVRSLLARFGIDDDDDVALLLKRLDVDHSGTVDLSEFLTVFSEQRLAHARHAPVKQRPLPTTAVQQRRERAARTRQSEDMWVQRAVDAHGSVRAAFEAFDTDASGELDYDEFRQLLTAFGISDRAHVETLTKRLDADASGAIDFDEFATIFYDERAGKAVDAQPLRRRTSKPPPTTTTEDRKARAARQRALEVKWMKRVLSCHPSIEAAFTEYDADGSQALDHDEFRRFMTRYGIVRDDDIASLLKRLDVDGSGTVDYEEFCAVFNPLRLGREAPNGPVLAGIAPGNDDELFNTDELASILEIERELAARMLEKTRDLRSAFRKYDLNGNGRLEYKEFRQVLRAYRFREPEIRRVIRHLDKTVSGYIDYKAFVAGFAVAKESDRGPQARAGRKNLRLGATEEAHKTGDSSGATSESRSGTSGMDRLKKDLLSKILSTYGTVQSVFRQYDSEQQGRLTASQFEALVTDHGLSASDARVLLGAFDQDRSGTIEYAEFLAQLVVRVAV